MAEKTSSSPEIKWPCAYAEAVRIVKEEYGLETERLDKIDFKLLKRMLDIIEFCK